MTETLPIDLFDRTEPGARKAHKREILRAALQCFNEFGVEMTPIDTIRERANSSIGSIYHHFGNKEGLIAAIYLAALDDQLTLTQAALTQADSPKASIYALVQSYLQWVTEEPDAARFLFRVRQSVSSGPHKAALAERNKQRYGSLLKRLMNGVQEGSIRALPPETYASLLIGQAESYCKAWLTQRVKTPPLVFAEVFCEAAWRTVSV